MLCKKILHFILDYLNLRLYRKSTVQSLCIKNELLQNRVENLRNRINQTYQQEILLTRRH